MKKRKEKKPDPDRVTAERIYAYPYWNVTNRIYRALRRVRREAERKRSLVEAAESVLAELRPKLQALEAQLHQKDAEPGAGPTSH